MMEKNKLKRIVELEADIVYYQEVNRKNRSKVRKLQKKLNELKKYKRGD